LRNTVFNLLHRFFQEQDFLFLQTPLITNNDAEGSGESFRVVTEEEFENKGSFFNKEAHLTVSGQLHAELFAQSFSKVYTFGPTFRAEKSNTTRHISEFYMLEPEIASCNLSQLCDYSENMIKFVIHNLLISYSLELQTLENLLSKPIIKQLNDTLKVKFAVITYDEVIKQLLKGKAQGHSFLYSQIEWGMDLQSEHESYICEIVTQKPTFIINYPKNTKAFYMKLNSDQKTVAAMDLVFPSIGEIIGGSVRENEYESLINRIREKKLPLNSLK
jgi:asparaginyl-tRNA synthetase